jgi:uncharacterized radical SAM protein YgiQ
LTKTTFDREKWLPVTLKEVKAKGWQELDVILITGDAYVDHPAFGAAVIGRLIEKAGLRIAIVPQPNWQDDLRDFKKFGKPRLFFGVTSGNMDSMINHYTANKRRRSNDAYTPGGDTNFRPDYALTVYCNILKDLYPDTPIITGGIEASLRRVTHYDYWADKLKPSILTESGADLLVYGMAEKPLTEILRLLDRGVPFSSLKNIPQTAFLCDEIPKIKKWQDFELASHNKCLKDKLAFASNFKYVERESNNRRAKRLLQRIGGRTLVINPPYPLMSEKEIDASFDLPYTRLPHPKYQRKKPIPAYEMIKHSLNMHRGCFGGCSFCTISAHQGRDISSRSQKSIMNEVEQITQMPNFKGYISDLGGPSANMYKMRGKDQNLCDSCVRPSCIYPTICSNMDTSHKNLLQIYEKVDNHPQIKKAFVSSGIRYDLFLIDETQPGNAEYLERVLRRHTSGRLKVAPEHTSATVLKMMRKPGFDLFIKLQKKFEIINKKYALKQQLIPYFISSHPGSEISDMAELAIISKKLGLQLEQIQDFTPTPMTVATVIYYSGYHPYTLKKVYTAKTKQEKLNQRLFFFWYKRENRNKIKNLLQRIGRADLADKLLSSNKKN